MNWLEERLQLDSGMLDAPLFTLAGTPITIATLVIFILIVIGTFLASVLIQSAVTRALTLRKVQDRGTIEVAKRLLHYAVVVTGLAIGLQTIGINLSALFAAGAVFAIGLGFAMQNIMQNFVSGVILLTERSVKPDDVVRVDGEFVRVQKMGIRSTVARTLDEEEVIIPNAVIVQNKVTNYTLQDSLYRLRTEVGVTYDSDMARVKRTLEEVAAGIEWRTPEQDPVVLLVQFGSSSVDWEVSVWMSDPWRMRRARSELNQAIWWALRDAEITIAFPQLDVHLDRGISESLQRLGRIDAA